MRKLTEAERYIFDSITGCLLLGSFVYAPCAYGSARYDHASFLALWLAVAFILMALKWMIAERRLPRVPLIPLVLLALLNLQGWIMVADPKAFFDKTTWRFVLLEKAYPYLPGTLDSTNSGKAMWVISGLSLGFIMLCDLAAQPRWRKRLLMVMAVTGAAIAIIGITLKVGGRPWMELVWKPSTISNNNFAFYRYHGNAAVFLYLTWPLALAFSLGRLPDWKRSYEYLGWIFAFIAIFVGVMVNISKAGVLISVVMLALFLRWRWHVRQRRKQEGVSTAPVSKAAPSLMNRVYLGMVAIIVCFSLVYIVATAVNSISGWTRWVQLQEETPMSRSVFDRVLVYMAASRAAGGAGWFGYGPATFSLVFPYYTAGYNGYLYGFWLFAHEDYLETLIEWGWVGSGLWGLFYFGGLARGLWNWWRPANFSNSEERMLLFACCLGLGATAIHASVDFPFQITSLRLYLLALLAVCWNAPYYAREAAQNVPVIRKKRKRPQHPPTDGASAGNE